MSVVMFLRMIKATQVKQNKTLLASQPPVGKGPIIYAYRSSSYLVFDIQSIWNMFYLQFTLEYHTQSKGNGTKVS